MPVFSAMVGSSFDVSISERATPETARVDLEVLGQRSSSARAGSRREQLRRRDGLPVGAPEAGAGFRTETRTALP